MFIGYILGCGYMVYRRHPKGRTDIPKYFQKSFALEQVSSLICSAVSNIIVSTFWALNENFKNIHIRQVVPKCHLQCNVTTSGVALNTRADSFSLSRTLLRSV